MYLNSLELASTTIDFLIDLGVRQFVISPGSRSAPLVQVLAKRRSDNPNIKLYVISDERAAAYFALGLCQHNSFLDQQNSNNLIFRPVVMICTSGTAALNYASAIAEAFYLQLPLLALTADRPACFVDQMDGQTIRQKNIYKDHVAWQNSLETGVKIDEALAALQQLAGKLKRLPCHLNLALAEPLYDRDIPAKKTFNLISQPKPNLDFTLTAALMEKLAQANKILIICGQGSYKPSTVKLLRQLQDLGVVIYAEHLANFSENLTKSVAVNISPSIAPSIAPTIDEALLNQDFAQSYTPDLCLSFGGALLSKRFKNFMRKQQDLTHWRVDNEGNFADTFNNLSYKIQANIDQVLQFFIANINLKNKAYQVEVSQKLQKLVAVKQQYLTKITHDQQYWSDLAVYAKIVKYIPQNSVLHLANSSVVRYMQSFNCRAKAIFSNRGTCGIDGCGASAYGFANADINQLNTLIIGDNSFLYEHNFLWHKHQTDNLKIIIINNGGGHIFSQIDGPRITGVLDEFFTANVSVDLTKLISAYGFKQQKVTQFSQLDSALQWLYAVDDDNHKILQIVTDNQFSATLWLDYLAQFKSY